MDCASWKAIWILDNQMSYKYTVNVSKCLSINSVNERSLFTLQKKFIMGNLKKKIYRLTQ